MFDTPSGEARVNIRGLLAAFAAILFLLLLPAQAMAQQSGDRSFEPRFAVGGGAQIGAPICFDCTEPSAAGFIGGFEVRLNDDWAFVTEGVWTGGHDIYSFEEGGVTYPGMTHDYYAFLNLKLRWEFTKLRHRPYMVFGGALQWHKDTNYDYATAVVDGRWVRDLNDVRISETTDVRGAWVVGFGWAFKVGERIEIRPEVDFHLGQWGYTSAGVTGWFKF